MEEKNCDVLIIGGGPAGAAAAIVLARAGIRATICERERFPRFHVGESLLPLQGPVLERLGLAEHIDSACFTPKYGAFFRSNDGSCWSDVDFERFLPAPFTYAYQVERSRFDELLLRHAERCGADVLEEHAVVEAQLAEERCRVRVRSSSGRDLEIASRWVIDASGQGSYLARRLGLRETATDLKKVAHFAHFRGGQRYEGKFAGHITLVLGDGCWFWHIPLSSELASVGCVVDRDAWQGSKLDAADFLAAKIAASPWLAGWLSGTERVTEVHTLANFSYTSKQFAGPGWTLVGDAATFLDPVFSTGVLLALRSGEAAAQVLADRIRRGLPLTEASFRGYQRKLRNWSGGYFSLIRAFYQPQFPAILFSPVDFFRRPVTHFLAGRLELAWHQRLVVWLFHWIIRLNKTYRVVADPRSPEAAIPHG
ncbi:MAG: tryptophan 7-halogenase [Thermoanaerobaculia bacterium]